MALKLQAEVGLDGSGFQAGLKQLGSSVKEFAAQAFGMAAVEEIFRRTIDRMEDLANASQQLDVGVEFLQKMGFAARQTGKDMEKVTRFIQEINASRLQGDKDAAYAKFGITDVQRMQGPEAVIRQIQIALQGKNVGDFTHELKEIGGKTAPQLSALLKDLDELGEAAEQAGAIIHADTIASVKAVKDEMQTLSEVMMAQLAPSIVYVMKEISYLINVIKSSGTFWGKFTSKKGSITDLLLGMLGGDKAATQRTYARLNAAGASSQSELEELNVSSDSLFKRLLSALTNPPSPGGEIERKARATKFRTDIPSDSLISAGNFLGTGGNSFGSILQEQVTYLKQIAYNTSRPAISSTTNYPP